MLSRYGDILLRGFATSEEYYKDFLGEEISQHARLHHHAPADDG